MSSWIRILNPTHRRQSKPGTCLPSWYTTNSLASRPSWLLLRVLQMHWERWRRRPSWWPWSWCRWCFSGSPTTESPSRTPVHSRDTAHLQLQAPSVRSVRSGSQTKFGGVHLHLRSCWASAVDAVCVSASALGSWPAGVRLSSSAPQFLPPSAEAAPVCVQRLESRGGRKCWLLETDILGTLRTSKNSWLSEIWARCFWRWRVTKKGEQLFPSQWKFIYRVFHPIIVWRHNNDIVISTSIS